MKDKVTVIIPAYNAEKYIDECLTSIIKQTYKNFEIIIVNDGSTDKTLEIVKQYENKHKNITVLNIKNHGQGYARNLALKKATGEYIMFIDADDFIEPVTFEVAINKIVLENSDFVYFDWKYYSDNAKKISYVSDESFFDKKYLEGNDCLNLLGIQHYFCVNKLYRNAFLKNNKIYYGENYIYEDFVFWTRSVIKAKKISIIHSPLYTVRVNDNSTTKTNLNSNKHIRGVLKAYDESLVLFKNVPQEYKNLFLSYILKKFLLYYNTRVSTKYKKNAFEEFYDRYKNHNIYNLNMKSRYFKLGKKMKFFNGKIRFRLFLDLYSMGQKIKSIIIKQKSNLKIIYKFLKVTSYRYFLIYSRKKIRNHILFMGFDYKYTGNSRYLFEKIKNKYDNIYFVTNSKLVNKIYRVEPGSKRFYKLFYTAKTVVFETWIPENFDKRENATWINLWHGTPLKKMFFDSNEEEIFKRRKKHKNAKYNTILKTDYLLSDNKMVNRYFETCFLMKTDQILDYGYPRVKYLIDNVNNKELRKQIRYSLNVDDKKKLIIYLPTWRDYNQDSDNLDLNYYLNKDKLFKYLGKDYVLVSKDHVYKTFSKETTTTDIETQELLLACDYLITDYSSVMFDAFAINIPVVIFNKDFEKYSLSRGVYPDIWNDIKHLARKGEEELAHLIKNYKKDDKYMEIREKYSYSPKGDLIDFLIDKTEK